MDTSQNGASISPICSECKSIFDHWYDRDNWAEARPGHSHHHIVGLQESSQNGCSVCAILLHGLSNPTVVDLTRGWPYLKSSVTVAPFDRNSNWNDYKIIAAFHFNISGKDKQIETSLDAFPSGNNRI